jgi:hypothetical protein
LAKCHPDWQTQAFSCACPLQALKSSGGFVWACKNYDGDVQSDIVAQVGRALRRGWAAALFAA